MRTCQLGLVAVAVLGACNLAHAGIVISYAEAPGDLNSRLANTSVMTFDSLTAGTHTNVVWTGVGTYDTLRVHTPDRYGAAGGTGMYAVQSTSSVAVTTLTFNTQHAYFGLWWSAGDNANLLKFYNGATLIASFDTAQLPAKLPSAYFGNPSGVYVGQNKNEPYAFLNFFGDENNTWDKVVFTNLGTSGFESDNHTDRVAPWTSADGPMPGVVFAYADGSGVTLMVPEPASLTLLAAGAVGLLLRRRRMTR